METYTWEVLPENMRSQEVAQQVAEEYFWTLDTLRERGLVQSATHSTT